MKNIYESFFDDIESSDISSDILPDDNSFNYKDTFVINVYVYSLVSETRFPFKAVHYNIDSALDDCMLFDSAGIRETKIYFMRDDGKDELMDTLSNTEYPENNHLRTIKKKDAPFTKSSFKIEYEIGYAVSKKASFGIFVKEIKQLITRLFDNIIIHPDDAADILFYNNLKNENAVILFSDNLNSLQDEVKKAYKLYIQDNNIKLNDAVIKSNNVNYDRLFAKIRLRLPKSKYAGLFEITDYSVERSEKHDLVKIDLKILYDDFDSGSLTYALKETILELIPIHYKTLRTVVLCINLGDDEDKVSGFNRRTLDEHPSRKEKLVYAATIRPYSLFKKLLNYDPENIPTLQYSRRLMLNSARVVEIRYLVIATVSDFILYPNKNGYIFPKDNMCCYNKYVNSLLGKKLF